MNHQQTMPGQAPPSYDYAVSNPNPANNGFVAPPPAYFPSSDPTPSYTSYASPGLLPGPLGQSGHPHLTKTVTVVPRTVHLTDSPATLTCPHCHLTVTTRTSTTVRETGLGWAFCLFCFCWPLMWLPCVMCLKTTHSCPTP